AAIVSLAAVSAAQRPSDVSICDYYTTALLKENNAANQQTLLTLVVNTAVIGNYTQPNVGVKVPGILAPGTMNGEEVNLLPYFNGGLESTNNRMGAGISVNFLDGGGAAPLMKNMPADSPDSAQFRLLNHLYGYFAYLLGCSAYGNTTMPYAGSTNMYQVHRFMALDNAEVGYFIQQVGLSAASFGVADADVKAVGEALSKTFGYRCSPPAAVPASAQPQLQAICTKDDCPLSPDATCSAYSPVVEPATNGTVTSMTNGTSS
ncbi:hypothetical protein K431DRAFT_204699, partial [Polychaeton citri CBS 116435]